MDCLWREVLSFILLGIRTVWTFIYNFQSLLAGLMALGAAAYALRPVYKQLRVAQVQAAISTREVLLERANTIIRRKRNASDALKSITSDFIADLYHNDPEGGPEIDINWAHSAEQVVTEVIDKLLVQQSGMGDREAIDDARGSVIKSATELRCCLTIIHQAFTHDFDDPDHDWDEQEKLAEIAKAERASKAAEGELEAQISAVARAARELDDAFGTELSEVRVRVQQINDLVLKEDHSLN